MIWEVESTQNLSIFKWRIIVLFDKAEIYWKYNLKEKREKGEWLEIWGEKVI